MNLDDKICYCYGVSMRKLMHYAQREQPKRASQMTECLGAGTGCGWCIPFLIKIANDPEAFMLEDMTPEEYAQRRQDYIKAQPKNTFDSVGDEVTQHAEDRPGSSSVTEDPPVVPPLVKGGLSSESHSQG